MGWSEALKHGHFSPDRDAGLRDPHGTRIDERLMVLLDESREDAEVPFVCTSGFRTPSTNSGAGGASDSAHLPDDKGVARAVDGHFVGWSLLEQFIHMLRFPFFAVGAYPYPPPGRGPARAWTPVVHVDRKDRGKPYGTKVLWIRNVHGIYVYAPGPLFQVELQKLSELEIA